MLRHSHLQPHRLAHAPTHLRLALVAGAALACTLCAGPISAAKAQPSPQTPQREQLTIPPEEAVKPWTGDLAGMIKRGRMRVLTVYSKTFYFVNKGLQRGATYDFVLAFEKDLNKRLAKEKKLKHKHLKVQVVFIPVARDDLLPALAAGKGDIAAANLTRTAERQQLAAYETAGKAEGGGVGAGGCRAGRGDTTVMRDAGSKPPRCQLHLAGIVPGKFSSVQAAKL